MRALDEDVANHDTPVNERGSSVNASSLTLIEGQPLPMAANGGLSYRSFGRDGVAGTPTVTEAVVA